MRTMTAAKDSLGSDDLAGRTPREIDTALAEHHGKAMRARGEQATHLDHLHYAVGDEKQYNQGRRGGKWKRSHEDVLGHDPASLPSYQRSGFAETKDKLKAAKGVEETANGEIDRHNKEFTRRGKWSRFFMVPDGHIHSSTSCHSTHETTEHRWLPDVSGKTEKEAVEAHGPTLCTHCFKSAPVEFKRNPSDVKREQNAGAKAEKAKAKAEKEEALRVKRRGPAVQPVITSRYDIEDHMEKAHEMSPRDQRTHPLAGNAKEMHDDLHQREMPFEHKHENPVHPHPTVKNIKTHMRAHHSTTPADLEWSNSVNSQGGIPPKNMEETHEYLHSADHYSPPKHTHGEPKTATMRTALDDTQAPTEVDTLRDSNCPVCGEQDSWDGDECSVCKYVKPPDAFDDPNLDVAKQMDLRDDGIDGPGMLDPTAQEGDAAVTAPSLFVPPAGSENPPGEDGGDDQDPEMGLDDDEEGEVDPEADEEVDDDGWGDDEEPADEDEEDDDEDDENPFKKKKKVSSLPEPGSAYLVAGSG